jgi:hypothetical protein
MTDLEIRHEIFRFVGGELDAEALEDWLEDASWEASDPSESLAPTALRLLAEHANGDWTDVELRERLAACGQIYRFGLVTNDSNAGSGARLIEGQASPAEGAETLRVAASV